MPTMGLCTSSPFPYMNGTLVCSYQKIVSQENISVMFQLLAAKRLNCQWQVE